MGCGMDMVLVLLVGEALIVIVFVLITAELVELTAACAGNGDEVSEDRSSSIIAS